jgi:Uma2 family endonuclease
MATVPSPPPEVYYPESDGKPLAETELHMLVMFDLIEGLRAWYAEEPKVWVGGDQLLYFVEGNPRKSTSPDVMVTLGIPKLPLRDTYLVWKEGKAPDFVIEVTSPKTRREDVKKKFELYRDVLKVREYFLFEPRQEYLKPPFKGYRLARGEYVPVPMLDGRLPSTVVGLHLEADYPWLRLYNPATGDWLPTATEVRERLKREAKARQRAEAARKRENTARKKAEAEVERLRREVEALRRRPPGQP